MHLKKFSPWKKGVKSFFSWANYNDDKEKKKKQDLTRNYRRQFSPLGVIKIFQVLMLYMSSTQLTMHGMGILKWVLGYFFFWRSGEIQ